MSALRTLLDNFEWAEGFEPRFGLLATDFATQQRTPRPSSEMLKKLFRRAYVPSL